MMLSSHRIPVLTRAHSIVLPEHLPEISDIGEPRVIRDFRYRTVFFPEQLCRILQPHGADIVSRGMAGERLQLVENPVRLMFCMPQSMSTQKPGLSIFFMTHSLTEAMNFQSRVLWQSGGTCPTPSSRPAYAV